MPMNAIRAVAFDCFGTLLHIRSPKNPWKALLAEARRNGGCPKPDPRREPIPTIEEFAAVCGVECRPEWRRDLDVEIASIEPAPDALPVLRRLRSAGFRLALASNLAPEYVPAVQRLLGVLVDVTCFSCDPELRAVKPEAKFFEFLQAKLGLPVSQVLMVGDNFASDFRGASAVGMRAVHLALPGGRPRLGQIDNLEGIQSILGLDEPEKDDGSDGGRCPERKMMSPVEMHVRRLFDPDFRPGQEGEEV